MGTAYCSLRERCVGGIENLVANERWGAAYWWRPMKDGYVDMEQVAERGHCVIDTGFIHGCETGKIRTASPCELFKD